MPRRTLLATLVITAVWVLGCTSAAPAPSTLPGGSAWLEPPITALPVDPTALAAEPSGTRHSAAPTTTIPTPLPPTVEAVGRLDCDGESTGADIDYGPDAEATEPDIVLATTMVRNVRRSDVIGVGDGRTSVIRDGRTVWIGSWSESPGGWLLYSYEGCRDAGVGQPPVGLTRDAIAEVVVGGVRVRSLPTVDPASVKYEPLLQRGDAVFIVDGPVPADGYDWILGQGLDGGSAPSLFGWVAAGGRTGEEWLDAFRPRSCPDVADAWRLGVIADEILLHCFGGQELAFELDASLSCFEPEPALRIEPEWLGRDCGFLSGDACGSCDLPVAADPASGISLPAHQSGRWSLSGHFDDPAAQTCVPAGGPGADNAGAAAVHRCRTTLVLTSLVRLGDSAR